MKAICQESTPGYPCGHPTLESLNRNQPGHRQKSFGAVRCFALLQFACAVLLLPCSIQAVPPVRFSAVTNYAVPFPPGAIAIADFNADGRPDLIAANYDPAPAGLVSVFLGLGGGVFQSPPTNLAVGSIPVSHLAIGDFDTNGHCDVVSASSIVSLSSTGSVSLLSGNGNGTFAPTTIWSVGDGIGGIVVGDFNRDHNPDIAVGAFMSSNVVILLGNGNGTFVTGTTNPVPGYSPHSIITADFNGDGKPDVVTTSSRYFSGGDVDVMLGNGDGTFGTVSNYHVANNGPVTWVGPTWIGLNFGDFNNDGVLDLVTANYYDGTSTFLKGQGDGTFLVAGTNGFGSSPAWVEVGDFNGDGNLDFVTANPGAKPNSLAFRLGNGDGTFETNFGTNIFLNLGTWPQRIAVADVNGDGKPDILTSNGNTNTVSVLLNQSIPTLKIAPADNAIRISWPDWPGYHLQSSTNLGSAWTTQSNLPAAVNGRVILTNQLDRHQEFYRLKGL